MYVSLILRRLDLFTRPLPQNGNSPKQFATVVQHSRRIWHHHLFPTTHHLIRSPSHPQLKTRALPLMALMAWCRMIFFITSWLLLIHIVTSHRQLHPKLCSQTTIFPSIGRYKKFLTLISIRCSWTRVSVLHFYQTWMCHVTSVVEDWLVPCLEITVTWVMKDGGLITCTRSEPLTSFMINEAHARLSLLQLEFYLQSLIPCNHVQEGRASHDIRCQSSLEPTEFAKGNFYTWRVPVQQVLKQWSVNPEGHRSWVNFFPNLLQYLPGSLNDLSISSTPLPDGATTDYFCHSIFLLQWPTQSQGSLQNRPRALFFLNRQLRIDVDLASLFPLLSSEVFHCVALSNSSQYPIYLQRVWVACTRLDSNMITCCRFSTMEAY